MHVFNYAHRDLKPQNILANIESESVVICDLGSAKRLTEKDANISYICTRNYRAPELFLEATLYST